MWFSFLWFCVLGWWFRRIASVAGFLTSIVFQDPGPVISLQVSCYQYPPDAWIEVILMHEYPMCCWCLLRLWFESHSERNSWWMVPEFSLPGFNSAEQFVYRQYTTNTYYSPFHSCTAPKARNHAHSSTNRLKIKPRRHPMENKMQRWHFDNSSIICCFIDGSSDALTETLMLPWQSFKRTHLLCPTFGNGSAQVRRLLFPWCIYSKMTYQLMENDALSSMFWTPV